MLLSGRHEDAAFQDSSPLEWPLEWEACAQVVGPVFT